MDDSLRPRRAPKWLLIALGGVIVVIGAVAAAEAWVESSHFRVPLSRYVAARTGREIQIDGPLEAHIFSLHPRVVAERVTVGNPPWMPPGRTAEIGTLSLLFDLPSFTRSFGIRRLEIKSATLHLARDSKGRANWQWTEPDKGGGKGPPLIRGLSMLDAHVELDDARRHLQFDGTVSAQEAPGANGPQPLRIQGKGQLNGRPATFAINGNPLATVSRDKRYHFAFAERSSGSYLTGRGSLTRPFDFGALVTTFEATGEDLKDLYYLTGVTLPNTGAYHLTGKLAREGTHFTFSDLSATSGQSDMRGTLSIETSSGRPQVDADLNSQRLRLSDLGARAAGRVPDAKSAKALLLPDTSFPLKGIRRTDGVVSFHARELGMGRMTLHDFAAKISMDRGVLIVTPLSAILAEGQLTGRVKLDATREVPTADADLRIANLQLSQFHRHGTALPPFDGPLRVRLTLTGHGRSIHQLAASANGKVTAVLPNGAIRASLAVLTGINLRGIGLLLARDEEETTVRCAVASFEAHDGTLTAQTLVIDTEPVLITGRGTLQLDSETLDLAFHGQPKSLRLRLRSPVLVRGTLAHPSFGIEAGNSVVRAGGAVALGVLLSPLAAVFAFVDPGLAKDAHCSALLSEVKSGTAYPR